ATLIAMLLGLIADTHGYLGDDALAALAGVDHILHAGDVGEGVLSRLRKIAPLNAVRGNNDTAGEAATLAEVELLDAAELRLVLVHRLRDAPSGGWDMLVFGHCHRQHAYREGARWLFNPGAAGRRGFHARRSVALLTVEEGSEPHCEFVDLGPRSVAH
ncbi:MAG: metallophosphoesterase family protein, partial [Tepidiformaceae bacterium]